MTRKRIHLIGGAGRHALAVAQRLMLRNYADLLISDESPEVALGRAQDLQHSAAVEDIGIEIIGVTEYEQTADTDLIVFLAGDARRPNTDRQASLRENTQVIFGEFDKYLKYSPESIILMVSNPVDPLVYAAIEASGFERERVLGLGAVTDEAFLRTYLAEAAGVRARDITTVIFGPHNKGLFSLARCTSVRGVPILDLISQEQFDDCVERVRGEGDRLTDLAGISPFLGAAAATLDMIDPIVLDVPTVLSSAIRLDGEYGLKDVCVSVPTIVAGDGVRKIIEMPLTDAEQHQLHASAEPVASTIAALRDLIDAEKAERGTVGAAR